MPARQPPHTVPPNEADLHAYIDGQLPACRRPAVEAYLKADPEAAARVAAWQGQTDLLRALSRSREMNPAWTLEIRTLAAKHHVTHFLAGTEGWRRFVGLIAPGFRTAIATGRPSQWATGGTALLAGIAMILILAGGPDIHHRQATDLSGLARDAALAHETGMAGQFAIVSGNTGPGVLAAPDLSGQGYHLLGIAAADAGTGRHLLYANESGQRRVSLFVDQRDKTGEGAFSYSRKGRQTLFAWSDDGIAFVLVGDIGRAEMLRLAKAAHAGLARQPPPRNVPEIRPAAHRM